MALDTSANRLSLIHVFPDLGNDENFKILSDCDCVYNCIAWAMGYKDRWVSPLLYPGYWWPKGAKRDMTPEALIEAFVAEGFELCDNFLPEEGYAKVILYKNTLSNEWTHATRILSAEIEYSKFGQAWDGQHSHNVLCHTSIGHELQSYGTAYAYMRRGESSVQSQQITEGKIVIDIENLDKLKALLRYKLQK